MAQRLNLDPGRRVGLESQKSYITKIASGFFDNYLSGSHVLDVGFAGHGGDGQPIVPQAIGIDIDYPGYDGARLPFPDESQDAIYSSHCFEHIVDHIGALRDWFRVLKVGGFAVIVVPHQHLFEKRLDLPSRWNMDHKRFFTPASLLADIEASLAPNSYRVRHLCDNDAGYDYAIAPADPATGCFEIELVLEKLPPPAWEMEDGASRNYGIWEFTSAAATHQGRWWIETDFATAPCCWVWGPYVALRAGRYRVELALEATGLGMLPLSAPIRIDIGRNWLPTDAEVTLIGESGANILRTGKVAIEFDNDVAGALHEFRIHLDGPAFPGTLRFYGASLVYLGRSR